MLARFIPIVRTFLNPVAGTLGMPARKFLLWNIVGAILWTDGILLVGYLLAQQIYDAIGDQIDHYILPVVALIVLISVLPILIEMHPGAEGEEARRRGGRTAGGRTGHGDRRGRGGHRGRHRRGDPRRGRGTQAPPLGLTAERQRPARRSRAGRCRCWWLRR